MRVVAIRVPDSSRLRAIPRSLVSRTRKRIPRLGRQLRLKKARKLRGMVGIMGWLIVMATVAGAAIGFGLLFGVFNKIQSTLSQSGIQIDQTFNETVQTAQQFTGTGLLIGLAIGVVGLVMLLITVIGSMGRREV